MAMVFATQLHLSSSVAVLECTESLAEKGVCKGKDFVEHDDLVGSRSKRWWFGGFPIKEMINCSMITSKSLPVGKTANPKIVKESENAAKEHFPVQNFVRTSWKCWKLALRAKKWLWICILFVRMRMSWATCLLLFVWLHVKKKKRNCLFGPVGQFGYLTALNSHCMSVHIVHCSTCSKTGVVDARNLKLLLFFGQDAHFWFGQ